MIPRQIIQIRKSICKLHCPHFPCESLKDEQFVLRGKSACPRGKWTPWDDDPRAAALPEKAAQTASLFSISPALFGPPMWRELHARPRFADLKTEHEFIAAFSRRIPCGKCKIHWAELLAKNPPDFSTKKAYLDWTINVHNRVNESLGKPIFDAENALKRTHPFSPKTT